MNSNPQMDKVIYIYADRSERSIIIMSDYMAAAEQLKHQNCIFARLNIDRNEIPELYDVEIPSLVILKGFGDLTAVNFEGEWTREEMRKFIYNRV